MFLKPKKVNTLTALGAQTCEQRILQKHKPFSKWNQNSSLIHEELASFLQSTGRLKVTQLQHIKIQIIPGAP